jgi:hypothetical protein
MEELIGKIALLRNMVDAIVKGRGGELFLSLDGVHGLSAYLGDMHDMAIRLRLDILDLQIERGTDRNGSGKGCTK